MKYFLRYLKPHVLTMCFGFFIKFSGTIMDLLIPYILSYIIDEVTPKNDIGLVVRWGLLMILCAALVLLANVWANRIASAVSRDVIHALRYDLFYRISYLSGSQVDFFTIPSLVTRMTSDTYNLHRMLNMIQRMGVRAPILFLGGFAITMAIDPYLSAILCVLLPFMILVVAHISKKSIPLFIQAQKSADNMIRVVRENSTGIRVIKALSRGQYEMDRYDTVNRQLTKDESTASNMLLNTGLVLVILVGAWRVSTGSMKPGVIVAFLTYFTIILNAVMAVSRLITMYSRAAASADRIAEVLNTPPDMMIFPAESENGGTGTSEAGNAKTSSSAAAGSEKPAAAPHIELRDVTFSYHKSASRTNLSHISLSLKHGQSLGIIGPTGAGKSTLVQLLLRLYDLDSGEIRIDGRNITTFPLKELRQKFGVVFQNDTLFKETLLENIDMGRKLSMDAIKEAAHTAQAEEFIEAAGGYDTQIAVKGANLSGGQKQRVLIARALSGRPEILILDDSSSALDYKTDAAFRKELEERYGAATTIIIAQRVSSILHCDQILVLEDGVCQGLGTHEELLKSCGVYREISEIQMGGDSE